MANLKERLENAIDSLPQFTQLKNNIDMTVTGEGLRLELLETEKGMFFESGNSRPTGAGNELLQTLAEELSRLPNPIVIEGHTDARPFSNGGGYTNWELSVDRANAARRMMQAKGVRADQIKQVRGYADQHLRDPKAPDNAANRRVSVIVQYQQRPEPEDKPHATAGHGGRASKSDAGYGAPSGH
jgi:chemotaxis protein MotB